MSLMIQIISLSLALLIPVVSLSAETSRSESAEISSVSFAERSNLVARAYLEILGRPPDTNGLITYAQHLQEGKSQDWVRAELRKSPEFRKRIMAQRLYHAEKSGILILACCLSLIIIVSSRNVHAAKILAAAATGICGIVYFCWIFRYAVNIPSWDDFDSILAYLNDPLSARLQHIFSLHNEHRIVFTRVLAEFSALFFGSVNFKFMTIIMSLSLVGIFYIFWLEWKNNHLPWPCFVLLPFLIFSPQPWVNMMHPVQYMPAYLMAVAAIYLLNSNKMSSLIMALILAVCSTYTTASGILVFPVLFLGILLAFVRNPRALQGEEPPSLQRSYDSASRLQNKGRYKPVSRSIVFLKLLMIAGCALGIAWLYFHNYQTPQHHARAFDRLKEPLSILQYFLCLVGASFGTHRFAVAAGIIILLFFGIATVKVARKDNVDRGYTFYLILTFLILNAAVISVGRSGLDISALDTRYRIISFLILSSSLGCVAQYWPAFLQRKLIFFFLCSAVIAGYAFTTIDISHVFEKHRKILIVETINWIKNRHGLHYPREGMERAGKIFNESINNGVYVLPACVVEILEQKNQANTSKVN